MRPLLTLVGIGLVLGWPGPSATAHAESQALRLLRSVSGPGGKVVGARFVLDEVRSRFVYPQDRSLTVYFEWETGPGEHVLTATWRQPDGRVASISPDVRIQTSTSELNCYWLFTLQPGVANGVWTVEIRVDGQPAGSHPFEVAGLEPARVTLDYVFKTYTPSIVKIHRLDAQGRRIDSSTGFVIGENAVATAFQSIDAANAVEVEWADSRRTRVVDAIAVSRLGDWAVLQAETGSLKPIPLATSSPPIGARVAVFNMDAGNRLVEPADIRAVSGADGLTTIQFSPTVNPEAVGGPLIDEAGHVVGIVGGSSTPGVRPPLRAVEPILALTAVVPLTSTAAAIGGLTSIRPAVTSLATLHANGTLTEPLVFREEFTWGRTARANDRSRSTFAELREFSLADPSPIGVFTDWQRRGRMSRGELTVIVYDVLNRVRMKTEPKRVSLGESAQQFVTSFSPKALQRGYYRVDVLWDGKPAWRTYFRIVD